MRLEVKFQSSSQNLILIMKYFILPVIFFSFVDVRLSNKHDPIPLLWCLLNFWVITTIVVLSPNQIPQKLKQARFQSNVWQNSLYCKKVVCPVFFSSILYPLLLSPLYDGGLTCKSLLFLGLLTLFFSISIGQHLYTYMMSSGCKVHFWWDSGSRYMNTFIGPIDAGLHSLLA